MREDNDAILVRTGDFSLLTTADFGRGPVVIPSAKGWAAAGFVLVVRVAACVALSLHAMEKSDDSHRAKLAYRATEQELTRAKAEIHTPASIVKSLEKDSADLAQLRSNENAALARAATLERAMKDEFRREIQNGDVAVAKKGTKVELTLRSWAVFDDDDIGKRGIDLLVRASALLAGDDRTVRVLAYTDDGQKDPWSTSSTQAATVVQFLEESAEMPALRLEAVGKGAVDPVPHSRARSRRIALVLDEK